ncbi:hypothetical protein N5T50_26720 [Escherichia coli]|uniref:hypothetical protein n=1 Tax=Escherichia coli TaxID=562 RepID=UPI002225C87E|nr:hypothetical protein [Escherichia coli]MCW3393099.1 hypothetical protein [Escherichia coli]
MPERYLTADTEGFRVLCERFWLFGSCISRQPGGCGLSWPEITVIKTDNIIVFQVVICPVQLNPVNENLPSKKQTSRYVVKLHDDDFFDEEDAEALRFDNFDDAVECCADLNIPFFVDAGNKSWSSGLYVLMTKGILK